MTKIILALPSVPVKQNLPGRCLSQSKAYAKRFKIFLRYSSPSFFIFPNPRITPIFSRLFFQIALNIRILGLKFRGFIKQVKKADWILRLIFFIGHINIYLDLSNILCYGAFVNQSN